MWELYRNYVISFYTLKFLGIHDPPICIITIFLSLLGLMFWLMINDHYEYLSQKIQARIILSLPLTFPILPLVLFGLILYVIWLGLKGLILIAFPSLITNAFPQIKDIEISEVINTIREKFYNYKIKFMIRFCGAKYPSNHKIKEGPYK